MNYFKVKIGFGDDDFISIDETDLRKALIAQVNGSVAIFNEGSIAGNSIISVLPDYNKKMGWSRDYKLTSEDYKYIGEKNIQTCRNLIDNTMAEIQGRSSVPLAELSVGAKVLGERFRLK